MGIHYMAVASGSEEKMLLVVRPLVPSLILCHLPQAPNQTKGTVLIPLKQESEIYPALSLGHLLLEICTLFRGNVP
jgi:hypothetical protein